MGLQISINLFEIKLVALEIDLDISFNRNKINVKTACHRLYRCNHSISVILYTLSSNLLAWSSVLMGSGLHGYSCSYSNYVFFNFFVDEKGAYIYAPCIRA